MTTLLTLTDPIPLALAVAVIGGLCFSTATTLLLLPAALHATRALNSEG